MTEHVHVGSHAIILASGRNIAPGDRVKRSEIADEDRYLVDDGVLVDVASFDGESNEQSRDELLVRARELNVEGRSKMTADELRQAVADAESATASSSAEGGN